ncbi:MAG TPA: hypothetical protein VFV51_15215, partial [Vicinamibacterales bacterium]|nr:hypothetical protein [Vicinamibacterales bacterium]
MHVRPARESDLDQLAQLWHDGWRDGHLAIVPAALARLRTLESFRVRLRAGLAHVCVAVADDIPVGFFMLKDDELYQFFVDASARGTGVAATM